MIWASRGHVGTPSFLKARLFYWETWAARHEHDDLKEGNVTGASSDSAAKEDKRAVAKTLFLERRWVQKGLFDFGWSDESAKPVTWRKAQKSTGSTIAQNGTRSDGRSHRFSERESNKNLKKRNGDDKQVLQRILSVKAMGTVFSKAGACQQKVSRATLPLTALFWVPLETGEHVAGQWCSRMMTKNRGLCMGRTARWRQNFAFQRTFKRAELTAFVFSRTHQGACRQRKNERWACGEQNGNAIDPKAGDADLWIKLWEELQLLRWKEILVEVEHVKAHRTKKEKEEMSHFEKVFAEGNEKADELAKAAAMLDEGYIA